jgi:predicted MPP superfamily phosphohydrolase
VVLLKHRPHISKTKLNEFDLQLSGHTHGGQIFPFIFFTRLQYKARHGLTKLAETTYLYLSRGTGSWGPQIRVFAPPEITVFDIEYGSSFELVLETNQKVVEK